MNLIIDANIIIAAMVRDSAARRLILTLPFKFYCPDFVFEEINKYLKLISRKNSLSVEENKKFLKTLSKYVKTVEYEFYRAKMSEAGKIIGSIDEKDAPYYCSNTMSSIIIPNGKIYILIRINTRSNRKGVKNGKNT